MATKSMRYAHSEGHTDICYDDSGRYLLTGGSDGDVRIWEGIDDDDPLSHRVGEAVYAVACKNERFYTASNDNSVRVHLFKEGQPDGLLLRFTAHVTHICFNKSGSKCFAGSSDFQIKIIDIEPSSQKLLQGHDAPVLSLSLSPKEHLLASSSCDGTVRVWEVESGKEVKCLKLLQKSNDFSLSPTICRLTWTADGKHLLIPGGKEVLGYSSDTWEKEFTLQDSSINELVNVLTLSPCGRYLAAACKNGVVVVWDMKQQKAIANDQHDKRLTITSLCWNPKGNDELAFADNHGNLGIMEGILPITGTTAGDMATASVDTMADLFADDDDDDMMMQASGMEGGGEGQAEMPIDSDDDGMPSMLAKSRPLASDDEASRDTALSSTMKPDEDSSSVPAPMPYIPRGPEPTQLQSPFQPGSTPEHLTHRFMVWNFIGYIRQYNTDEENSIDVEFHDTATHHPIHVTNTMNHTMAGLSAEAVALACESDEDSPSKVVCMHYASSDTNKEWTVAMPGGEEIQALTLGEGWLAVATDERRVRLFTVGGLQKEVFAMPGPVVCMAGHTNQLIIVYHKGVGLPGDQNLGVLLMTVTGKRKAVIRGDPLPIAPKSTLTWLGFSHEGTPIAVDSSGLMYILNRQFSNTWTEVADTRANCKGKSDHNFIVGVQENPAQIRCIACKGARYPPTLPRPVMTIIQFQLPLCEGSTEKGQLEESYWRSLLLSNHLSFLSSEGYEIDETAQSRSLMAQQEVLMKMFALACKTQRESRAMEICELMPTQHAVQLAVKYATRLRFMQLATQLNELAHRKAAEEMEEEEEEEPVYVAPQRPVNRSKPVVNGHAATNTEAEEEMEADDLDESTDIYEEISSQQDGDEEPRHKGPMLSMKPSDCTPKTLCNSQPAVKKNPFKKAGSQSTPTSGTRGSSVFDSLQRSASKTSASATPEDKPIKNKKRGFSQMSIMGKKKEKPASQKENTQKQASKTAFQLWYEANREELVEEHPDLSEVDLTVTAARTYKELSDEDKKEWQEKAASSSSGEEERKRKREGSDSSEKTENKDSVDSTTTAAKKKRPFSVSSNSKLAAFAFTKS